MIQVDTDVPMPQAHVKPGNAPALPFDGMTVGSSFRVPCASHAVAVVTRNLRNAGHAWARRRKVRASFTLAQDGDGVRIWLREKQPKEEGQAWPDQQQPITTSL